MKKLLPFLLMIIAGCHTTTGPVKNLQWKIAGELPALGNQPTALGLAGPVTGVSNDVLIVAGGANFPDSMPWLGGKKKYYGDVYIFNKTSSDSLQFLQSYSLPFSIAYAATCTTPDGVFAAGGENENGMLKNVFLIGWDAQKKNINVKDLPALPFAVTNAAAVCVENRIYLAGGEILNSVSNAFLTLDLQDLSSGWTILSPIAKPVSHAVMVATQNEVYLLGGRKRNPGSTSDLYKDVFAYDIKSKHWSTKSPLPFALSAGTGAVIHGSYIFLFGGDTGETFHATEVLLAEIAKESNEGRKSILNADKATLQSSHPGFSREVLMYDIEINKWKHFDSIPLTPTATTTAVIWNGEVIIPSGEIRAGVRTPKILSAKFN